MKQGMTAKFTAAFMSRIRNEQNKYDASQDWNRGYRTRLASKQRKKTDDAAELKHSFEFSMLANPRHERFRGDHKCGRSNLDGDTQ